MFDKIIEWCKFGLLFMVGICCFMTSYFWGIVIGLITMLLSALQIVGKVAAKNDGAYNDKIVNAIYDEDSTFDDIL